MSKTIEYDFQTPKYTSPAGKFIKLDTVNNQIEINDPTVPKQILINTVEISNGVQNINFVNLYEKLDAVKATVYPAPSSTQLQVENSIIVSDTPGNKGITIDAVSPAVQVSDLNTGIYTLLSNGSLFINDPSQGTTTNYFANNIDAASNNYSVITAGNTLSLGDVNSSVNSTRIILTDNTYSIDSNALNLTTYNSTYALPICYTKRFTNTISYIGVNNTWQNVYQDNLALPNEFFNPSNTFWDYKIEFSINLRNMSASNDKGLALYFEFLDNASNIISPFLYTQNTPFTRHSNDSTYSATSSNMLTFNWNDYCNFTAVPNNAPLTFSLWWYGDQNNSPDFSIVLSLTRTNLV